MGVWCALWRGLLEVDEVFCPFHLVVGEHHVAFLECGAFGSRLFHFLGDGEGEVFVADVCQYALQLNTNKDERIHTFARVNFV